MFLSSTVLYDRYWKKLPMRKLIGGFQILYALSLLLDLVLVKQINLKLGIPNETFAICFSGVAETVAQLKLLPFSVLLASLCPPDSEGALISFLASALCLSQNKLRTWKNLQCSLWLNKMPMGWLSSMLRCLMPCSSQVGNDGSSSVAKSSSQSDKSKGKSKPCSPPIVVSYFPVNSNLSSCFFDSSSRVADNDYRGSLAKVPSSNKSAPKEKSSKAPIIVSYFPINSILSRL
ncbi:Biopterin transporter family [Dillenia turbinata]|uniref:Biopterin transporter family n=1 Tax=Dillenia turbinata TaxID=194707 RepID=A0AAN8VG05_9MAGN